MSVSIQEILTQLSSLDPEALKVVNKEVLESTRDKIWVPNSGPQRAAAYSAADELFYGGQAGGGKTDLIIGLSLTAHKRSLVLRRTNKEAEKLPDRYIEVLGTDKGLNRNMGWRLGDRIIDIGGCQLEGDKQKRKGIPHDLKAFDEIADFTETQYTFICAWNRSTDINQRCRIICTGNPPTDPEGFWVIQRWAAWLDPTHPNPAKDGELRWYTTDPKTGHEIEVDGHGPHEFEKPDGSKEMIEARSRTFIRSTLDDNPDLARTNYDAVLASLPERERLAYREGRFDVAMQDRLGQTIPTEWVREAQMRWTEKPPEGIPMCAMGCDMSGGGKDPMIIFPRYDSYFARPIEIEAVRFDVTKLSQQAAGFIVGERRDKALVTIDLGGGYGSGTYEQLLENDVECFGYKGSEASNERSKDASIPFRNVRSAAIWKFREALDPSQPGGSDIALPRDCPELVADLTAPTYKIVSNKIIIESKEDVVARLGRSTDRGDACVMAWYRGRRMSTHALDLVDERQRHMNRGQSPKVIMGRKPHTGRR